MAQNELVKILLVINLANNLGEALRPERGVRIALERADA
jgi:hypothetical protein